MIIERRNNEILIRFDAGENASKIQSILNYLRYEELTSKSEATEDNGEHLVNLAKKNRWNRMHKGLEIK